MHDDLCLRELRFKNFYLGINYRPECFVNTDMYGTAGCGVPVIRLYSILDNPVKKLPA